MKPRDVRSRWWWGILAFSMFVAAFLAPFASPLPDGLERVARDLGFLPQARTLVPSCFEDYRVPGLSERWGMALSALVGTLTVFLLTFGIGRLLLRRRLPQGSTATTDQKVVSAQQSATDDQPSPEARG